MQKAKEQSSHIAKRSAGAGRGDALASTLEKSVGGLFCIPFVLIGRFWALTFALAGP